MIAAHDTRLRTDIGAPPVPYLGRRCACGGVVGPSGECKACRKKRLSLQRKAKHSARDADQPSLAPPIVHEVLRTGSRPLQADVRHAMETRFGYDFSQVRVHTDRRAAESARAVNALAYTVGRDIVFGTGQYTPATVEGGRLLSHELTHTLQNRAAPRSPSTQVEIMKPTDPLEQEAQRTEGRPDTGERVRPSTHGDTRLARQTSGESTKEAEVTQTGGSQMGASPAGAGPAGQTVGTGVSFTLPTCTSSAMKTWISDPQQRGATLFGLTTLSGAGGKQPEFNVEPAPGGKGVKVKRTFAALLPIDMKFLDVGQYADSQSYQWQCDPAVDQWCVPGHFVKPQVIWDVTADGSARLAEGEREHCADFQMAFYLILGRASEIVNDLADSGTTFPNEAAAKTELQKTVKLDPRDWVKYFACLAQTTQQIRDRRGWHTPLSPVNRQVRSRMKITTAGGRQVAKAPILLPGVKSGTTWLHPVMEVILEAATTCNVKIPWTP